MAKTRRVLKKRTPKGESPITGVISEELDVYSKAFKDHYLRLKAALKVDVKRANLEIVRMALDECESNALEASYLCQVSKEEFDREMIRIDADMYDLELDAQEALGKLKAKGKISGQVTKDLITGYLSKHSKRYGELRLETRRLKHQKRILEIFKDQWRNRAATLRALKDTYRD